MNIKTETYGTAKIVKTSEDGIVSGISFRISGTDILGNEVSFYLNDVEVAYISNGKLYISEAEIFGFKLKTGKWLVNTESDYWNLEWEG